MNDDEKRIAETKKAWAEYQARLENEWRERAKPEQRMKNMDALAEILGVDSMTLWARYIRKDKNKD